MAYQYLVRRSLCLGAALACAAGLSWAAEIAVPEKLDLSELVNQHGQPFQAADNMTTVMLVGGMKMKGMVRDALEELNVDCLREGRVVYLANISGMPKLISKMVAVPKLRNLDYPVWLDYSGDTATTLPAHKGEVTLLSIASPGQVSAVSFVSSPEALLERLLPECGAREPAEN